MNRIVLPALCAIGFSSASILVAQSTLPGQPQIGSTGAATNARLNALRALVANSERQNTVQSYMSAHPLFVSPRPMPMQLLANLPPNVRTLMESQAQRPECPMPVSAPATTNDSMRVSRTPSAASERMPVSAPLCTNPLGPKH